MERHAVLRTLRNGELPPEFVSRWPKEAAFVLWLMAEDPRMRPTAREILEFDLIRKVKEDATGVGYEGGAPTEDNNDVSSASTPRGPGRGVEGRQKEDLHGLGLSTDTDVCKPWVSSLTRKPICEACQARCQCSSSSPPSSSVSISPSSGSNAGGFVAPLVHGTSVSTEANASTPKPRESNKRLLSSSQGGRGHRSSKSISNSQWKPSRSDLEQKLGEETERSKRLEMSLEAMRAEQKALLDRIQALEYEKEIFWRTAPGGGGFGPVDDDDEL